MTDREVRAAVAAAETMTDALRRLGLRPAGGNYVSLRRRIARLGLSTDHFDAEAVRRRAVRRAPVPLAEVLVEDSSYPRGRLKRRLYEEGLKDRACERCGQDEIWQGRRMALILDHVNGRATDNRLENLQIVCPNCAATLDTHCGRNFRLPRDPHACLGCGGPFLPRRQEQRYCSRECGMRWDRASRPPAPWRGRSRPPYAQLLTEVAAEASPPWVDATASATMRSASGSGRTSAKRPPRPMSPRTR